jgi:hypothetical protein
MASSYKKYTSFFFSFNLAPVPGGIYGGGLVGKISHEKNFLDRGVFLCFTKERDPEKYRPDFPGTPLKYC